MANTVRGTPFRSIGPNGNAGTRGGTDGGQTVDPNYRGTGINTAPNTRGTPESYKTGNPDNARSVVSSNRQGGVVLSEHGINHNDPNANGDGVVLDNVGADYSPPGGAPTLDSPVPGGPVYDSTRIPEHNSIAMGRPGAGAEQRDSILNLGGVMSRGMVGCSTPGGPEDELMHDDTLPGTPPA